MVDLDIRFRAPLVQRPKSEFWAALLFLADGGASGVLVALRRLPLLPPSLPRGASVLLGDNVADFSFPPSREDVCLYGHGELLAVILVISDVPHDQSLEWRLVDVHRVKDGTFQVPRYALVCLEALSEQDIGRVLHLLFRLVEHFPERVLAAGLRDDEGECLPLPVARDDRDHHLAPDREERLAHSHEGRGDFHVKERHHLIPLS